MAKTPVIPPDPTIVDYTQDATDSAADLTAAKAAQTAATSASPQVPATVAAADNAVTVAQAYADAAAEAKAASADLDAAVKAAVPLRAAAAAPGAKDADRTAAATANQAVLDKNTTMVAVAAKLAKAKAQNDEVKTDAAALAAEAAAASPDATAKADLTDATKTQDQIAADRKAADAADQAAMKAFDDAAAAHKSALALAPKTATAQASVSWGTGGSFSAPIALDSPSASATSRLSTIVKETKMVQQGASPEHSINLLSVYADQLANNMVAGKTALQTVNARIAEIDKVISAQMDQILHDPNFQALEAAWNGLAYLVKGSDTGDMMKLRLLNATKKELADDFDKATDKDQSALFKKVYEEEYGTFGGYPFSVLVGDYYFDRTPGDMNLLSQISGVAAAAHAPFLSAADPGLFDMGSFSELSKPRDLGKQFDSTELIKWKSFRESEDSRYVALTLPHVLMRMPYGAKFTPVETFDYTEQVSGPDTSKFLWGNSAYALAQRITSAFSLYHWCAAIRGVEGGGLIEGLPTYTFRTDDGLMTLTCPTETTITDRREFELSKLGFIAICHKKNTDQAAFFGGQTVNKPQLYDLDDANANAALSARLPYILATSRFAHYIKVMMRDKIGSFATKENVSNFLNQWLAGSILLNDDAPQAVKAAYPLREGRVDVFDEPGKPGSYRAVVYLRPHFQLEELTVSMRLVAELPAPAK